MELKSRLLYGEITFPSSGEGIVGIAAAAAEASGLFLTFVEGADKGRFLLELFVLVVLVAPDPGVVGGVLAVGAVIVGGVVAVVSDKKWFFVFSKSSNKFDWEFKVAGDPPVTEPLNDGGVGNGWPIPWGWPGNG